MQSLIKIPLLLVFLCISAFSDTHFVIYAENKGEFTRTDLESMGSGYYKEFANGKYTFYKARGYSIESGYFFDSDTGISDGIYRDQNGNFFVVDSAISLDTYCDNGFTFRALRLVECASSPVGKIRNHIQGRNSTKMILDIVAQCNADENFNTDTQQCQKCPDGQSWNPATNSCFNDCTDLNKNKYGFTDGSCADCSGEKESFDVKKCYCNFIGSTPRLQDVEIIQGDFRFTTCSDGSEFWYKIPGTPDVDNNKTKPDLKKPSPGGNGTKPDDPNNPDQGGGNNQGNNGGNQGNPKPNPNPGNNTNPNPDPKPNPKPGNGNSTNRTNTNNDNGGDNKDGEAKFNKDDFNDEDLSKERDGLYDGIKGHILDNLSKFDGIRDGINQFVSNVQLKGFEKVQPSIKGKCPIKKQISLPGGRSQEIVVDYCENLAPVSEISYYAFYVGFAIGGFILMLKLFIFSF